MDKYVDDLEDDFEIVDSDNSYREFVTSINSKKDVLIEEDDLLCDFDNDTKEESESSSSSNHNPKPNKQLQSELTQSKKLRLQLQEHEKKFSKKIQEFDNELLLIKKMKQKMQKQCSKYDKLIRDNTQLKAQLTQKLEKVNKSQANLDKLQSKFQQDQQLLSKILANLNTKEKGKPANAKDDVLNVNENFQILKQLRTYFSQCENLKSETKKIKSLYNQQQKLVQQCKIDLENMRTSYRDNCLVSLDKSKSYSCKECDTDIGLVDDIESKCYQVGQGSFTEKKRGYLFKQAFNLVLGEEKTENFTTGAYQISWVSCVKCQAKMGWKYVSAAKETAINKQKVGKYCLARYSMVTPDERNNSSN